MKLTPQHIQLSRKQHRIVVAGGIICCAVVTITMPEHVHLNALSGMTINLFWLFMEPEV